MDETADAGLMRHFYRLVFSDGARNVSGVCANPPRSEVLPAQKSVKRLRALGLMVLLLGLAAAGAVYGIRTHTGEPTEDELLTGNAKAEAHQMEILYGKMGLLTHELSDDLKRPGTQACLIAAASILAAAGLFYVARLSDDDEQTH